ncbi:Uncharacterized protein dnm_082350 [Desulfonema magnum]|uniref:Uncharacterized protein n=1 Tax=Desulfonema magnum TaxID=45655 RepID=A0A975GQG4_9BACT|nr:Uncharacterized protein dnm_004220 [Desulfonema magnum]QTA85691.1 Uncharacterized protein dnm_017050 [Desulfonema magnum]QTA88256.1 Uncharacterized protein dnm_042980 [Desulfonema magnum]QTA88869.1 Uncharacterized protein dnm_049160 [Desulfonema magnum]QTA88918.1 Uncharacterized protein dnm_049650 [Desulfonema magnum]
MHTEAASGIPNGRMKFSGPETAFFPGQPSHAKIMPGHT